MHFFLSERGELEERFTGFSFKQNREGDGSGYGDSGSGERGDGGRGGDGVVVMGVMGVEVVMGWSSDGVVVVVMGVMGVVVVMGVMVLLK